ncbi:MAG: pyridoxal 5'-phosphate synthase glutaminase subunit PdxT, partial [Candidatus Thermoplasmatota archaeon]|nr:pyridoxal 5'-phosphate synthase glutaminase subunit PdxT [Candidatus Thermoplasmatota archaeon]
MVGEEIISIGVIGIQGAVSEHVSMMEQVFLSSNINGTVEMIRPSDSLEDVDGVILPGGESTTISRLLLSSGLFFELRQRAKDKTLAIMGTCAGCVLLSSELGNTEEKVDILELIPMRVQRNGYGRQKESFEHHLDISKLNGSNTQEFPGVFIRAPVVEEVWGKKTTVLAVDTLNRPVIVKQ